MDQGCFELSVGNPDKGLLPLEELRHRVQQFLDAELPLVVTHVSSSAGLMLQRVPSVHAFQEEPVNHDYNTSLVDAV